MTQICLRNITIGYSHLPLLTEANLYIESKERVCLIGRNGAGKSTLLKLIHGDITPDEGQIEYAKNLKIALLPQAVPHAIPGLVKDIVANNFAQSSERKDDFLVAKILSKLGLDGERLFNDLSGGLKRLVLLASILINEPDVILLDEPTNHLDIDAILYLENLLLNLQKTIIFVTHDRSLLQKLSNHIVEIDNGRLISWKGNYQQYLNHKETLIEAESKANALFDKKLAEEEKWIRQGIKARRTRNEGRVRRLEMMRLERNERRSRPGQINLTKNEIIQSGKIVFQVKKICFAYQNKTVIQDFSTIIQRGDKVGIIGANGSGKTTLINLLIDNLSPNQGSIECGTKLMIGYFDQHRIQLDENKSIYDEISDAGDTILINGKEKHIYSYLQDFLFSPQQARTLIKNLSGGERNRVMLAKLFSKPCNLLILDEPTNDLDVETLELLEEMLVNFDGTILLISHDRTFLNNVVTSTLVFTENGKIEEYVGGYEDWTHQTAQREEKKETNIKKKAEASNSKLTYKEKQELAELPKKIEQLEKQQHEITQTLADPNFYKENPDKVTDLNLELVNIEKQISDCYERWSELEARTD